VLSFSLFSIVAMAGWTPALAFDTRTLGYGQSFLTDFSDVHLASSPKLKAEIDDALGKKADDQCARQNSSLGNGGVKLNGVRTRGT